LIAAWRRPQSAELSHAEWLALLSSIASRPSAISVDCGPDCAMPRVYVEAAPIIVPRAGWTEHCPSANCRQVDRGGTELDNRRAIGVSKSWLTCALGQKACRDNRSVLHQRIPRVFAYLALARGDGRYPRPIGALGGVKLLMLDDWGLEPLVH